MKRMLDETTRRREKQLQYNIDNNISPKTIYKSTEEVLASTAVADVRAYRETRKDQAAFAKVSESVVRYLTKEQRGDLIEELKTEMRNASKDLEFERAAGLRDEIDRLEKMK